MRRKKSIRVGIWSYDNPVQICKYAKGLKKILYNISMKGEDIVLVSAPDGEAYEMVLGISRLLGLRYDIWLSSKPSQYTKKFDEMEYAIFNRVLFGARGYKIVPSGMESAAISNNLDVLILLMDGKIHIADISSGRDKETSKIMERQDE